MLARYKIKDAFQRSGALLGAVVLLVGLVVTAFPAAAFADALNPLTERSLTLSSSSPGWSYLDGSGNTTYAPPHSGANGQKTGNTFSYRMSSYNTTVRAITFQYCTTPAGNCIAPGTNTVDASTGVTTAAGTGTIDVTSGSATVTGTGTAFTTQLNVGARIVTAGNNVYTVLSIASATSLTLTANAGTTETGVAFDYRIADSSSTSDLNAATSTPTEISGANWTAISASADKTPAADDTEGNFVVLYDPYNGAPVNWGDYTQSTGWTMTTSNSETGTLAAGTATGRNNKITITSAGGRALNATNAGDYFKVIFFGTNGNYITNPGAGAFFVRMNTYSDVAMTTLIDGGVTVANVMNESISIRTKVLETMDFSVGTYDPTLYLNSELTTISEPNHGQCNTLLMANPDLGAVAYAAAEHNVLNLGNSTAEYSLETGTPYAVQSYWRLSSNSSGGATVYYTGHTLTNTVGDEIAPLDQTAGGTGSQAGTEQFGLAIAHDTETTLLSTESYPVWLDTGETYGDEDALGDGDFASYVFNAGGPSLATDDFVHYPRLYPLVPQDPYDGGAGTITSGSGTAKFAFNQNADSYAVPIATNSTQVVNCVTAKMRYIANIAATTPAGVYTTKINYVASPQY